MEGEKGGKLHPFEPSQNSTISIRNRETDDWVLSMRMMVRIFWKYVFLRLNMY